MYIVRLQQKKPPPDVVDMIDLHKITVIYIVFPFVGLVVFIVVLLLYLNSLILSHLSIFVFVLYYYCRIVTLFHHVVVVVVVVVLSSKQTNK